MKPRVADCFEVMSRCVDREFSGNAVAMEVSLR